MAPPPSAPPASPCGDLQLGWDDRVLPDRRRRPTPMLSRYAFLGGRRSGGRRHDELGEGFADLHGAGLFLVVTSICALNMLDALFTILFLSHGGTELNPIVDQLLQFGLWPFVLTKCLGIGVCVVFLTMTRTFTIARLGLGMVLVGYAGLLGWHLYLLGTIPE